MERTTLFERRGEEIRVASFSPAPDSRCVGAEVEFLALEERTAFPLPLLGTRRSLVPLLRPYGARAGWKEEAGYGPVPKFAIPGKGIVSFEPGGQLEFSADPQTSIAGLVRVLESVVRPVCAFLRDEGVRLESVGIDPVNDARQVPLQLPVERYETMTRYFDRRGPFGVRMMRQTAAIQISLDRGALPVERWQLLNDLAPYVIAVFANSPHYRAENTGHRSYRAHCWRMLDATRTGVTVVRDNAWTDYARFAFAASDMMRSADGQDTPFSASDRVGDERAWQTHLTTLFPEVRPRGHFEVRSCDAIDPDFYAAPIMFLAALAYDETSAKEAGILAGESRALLRVAGERGLRDATIARTSRDLFQLALAGARRLGDCYCGGKELEIAKTYFDRFTARDRSPADDRVLQPGAPTPVPARST